MFIKCYTLADVHDGIISYHPQYSCMNLLYTKRLDQLKMVICNRFLSHLCGVDRFLPLYSALTLLPFTLCFLRLLPLTTAA